MNVNLLGQIKKVAFRLGSVNFTLEVPPFYIDFEKKKFGSIMTRRDLPEDGLVIYVYVTRRRHVENLLLLKRLHPDISMPEELEAPAAAIVALEPREFEGFMKTLNIKESIEDIQKMEEEWTYVRDGVWLKKIDSFILYMLLIVKESRWTVRPAISKEKAKEYGYEVPVDAALSEAFAKHLRMGELEEIHDHIETRHFHLAVNSLKRCVELTKEWDYYFSTRTKWRQTVFLSAKQLSPQRKR